MLTKPRPAGGARHSRQPRRDLPHNIQWVAASPSRSFYPAGTFQIRSPEGQDGRHYAAAAGMAAAADRGDAGGGGGGGGREGAAAADRGGAGGGGGGGREGAAWQQQQQLR
jgi:hypothetical protein